MGHFSIKNNTSAHHKIAHLIRDFFNSLPNNKLLDNVSNLQRVRTYQDAGNVTESMSDPQKSLLMWLLDLLVNVIEHSEQNRMSIHILSKSMAPNLISTKSNIGAAISFLKCGIEWRLS